MFDLTTGGVTCSPATKPLAKYETRIESDSYISVNLTSGANCAPACSQPLGNTAEESVVIVGAGAAGTACAEELARTGFGGKIHLITKHDNDKPYDR